MLNLCLHRQIWMQKKKNSEEEQIVTVKKVIKVWWSPKRSQKKADDERRSLNARHQMSLIFTHWTFKIFMSAI